jgi:hypothetical protein
MLRTHHMKQTIGNDLNETRDSFATASRKRAQKAPGTRLGILQNWRGGFALGKSSGRFGNTLRDGR